MGWDRRSEDREKGKHKSERAKEGKKWNAFSPLQFRRIAAYTMPLSPPVHFNRWVSENAEKLTPPVNNFCLYDGSDFTVMAVGGPNARKGQSSLSHCRDIILTV